MLRDPSTKYRPFPTIALPDRQWPNRTITKAPRWLSTDLRDGNQALIDPMDAEKKTRMFDLLVKVGLKEIEVGFPSAGATEFDFISGLIREDRIPEDVTIQVLTQSRRDLIERSFESLEGARTAIVHLYNAVSPAWRKIVFGMTRDEVRKIAVEGAKILRDEAAKRPNTDWFFEYSPETFSTAELDFSVEVCAAVMDVLKPTPDHPLILNLPATVECATPNVYADQIEWFGRNIPNRDSVVISLPIGMAAAFALYRYKVRGRGLLGAYLLLGFSTPLVVSGMAFLVLFNRMGQIGDITTLAVAIMTVNFPFMLLAIGSSIDLLNPELEEAAATLGAEKVQRFLFVTLPFAGCVTMRVTVSGPPLGSLSLSRTSIAMGVSSGVVALSSSATGGPLTTIVTSASSLSPLSALESV